MVYLLGDTGIAAQRLKIVSEIFAETTRTFLMEMSVGKLGLIIDLGCGPGYSTQFLQNNIQCDHIAGLDNSEYFIMLARQKETEKISFFLHDVTSIPFPIRPADLLYCRFLLTHLKNPIDIILRWVTQLKPSGLLFIEELEWIHTSTPVFIKYLKILKRMLESYSNNLFVGKVLKRVCNFDSLKLLISKPRNLKVSEKEAANMFFLNLQSLKKQPFIYKNFLSEALNQIEKDLYILANTSGSEKEIEWCLRQLVFERL